MREIEGISSIAVPLFRHRLNPPFHGLARVLGLSGTPSAPCHENQKCLDHEKIVHPRGFDYRDPRGVTRPGKGVEIGSAPLSAGAYSSAMFIAPLRRLVSYCLRTSWIRQGVWNRWYRYVGRTLQDSPIWFMNYGFAPPIRPEIQLTLDDEPNRTSIQLYHRVAGAVPLGGRDVLEVSCGRGGGARFVAQYLGPRRLVGLDLTESAVAFCARHHRREGVNFVCGNAQRLPFPDGAFDAVLNVEASHCYPDVTRFFAEARRVLRSSGYLLYADLRGDWDYAKWREQIAESGFEIVEEEEITPFVVKALDTTDQRTRQLVGRFSRRIGRRLLLLFAAAKGTAIYDGFASGRIHYLRFVLRRTALS